MQRYNKSTTATMCILMDAYNGDSYYKIKYPTHNLDRARNQLAFFEKVKDLK